ncbi:MAG: hypothetical protein RLZZ244_2441, partial [Verrucomicrobiota bacterium]
LAEIQDPYARHWLIFPGKGRAETALHLWARRSGIASHSQEVQLRELLEGAASGAQKTRFDFDRLRLACASALPSLASHPRCPLPPELPLSPLSAAVLDWSSTLAQALDDALLCRPPAQRWESGSFLETLASHPDVQGAIASHLGCGSATDFTQGVASWMDSWEARGGIPHLWIQLDGGIPSTPFERLRQFLALLQEHHADRLHLFALSPSSEYWAEARLRRRAAPLPHPEEHHPGSLLWALGQSAQDLHRQLADSFLAEGDGGLFLPSPPPPDSRLGRLQLACRNAAPLPEPSARENPEDASFTVHSARSGLRELEVCRDRILQALRDLPDLRFEEILLLLADPQRQAPLLEAAFRLPGATPAALPFRLLGLGQSCPTPWTRDLQTLLRALRGRIGLEEIQMLLEAPLIASQFGFEEADTHRLPLLHWLQDAQFRWGSSPEHRAAFQPLDEIRWNLRWALQRLALGALVPRDMLGTPLPLADAPPLHSTLPPERASGLSLNALASLARFAQSLENARKDWNAPEPHPMEAWIRLLQNLCETFLDSSSETASEHFSLLFGSILPQLQRAVPAGAPPLSAEAFLRLLDEKLSSLSQSRNRGSGGIRIADLRHYAGVPARMVLVAGLDDGTFPRRDDRPEWHPLHHSRKPGDPSQRDADRHALLLSILACSERLVLTYQGGSDEDSKKRPPSPPVADLLQALGSPGEDLAPGLLHEHPLHGLSPEAFRRDAPASGRAQLASDYRAALLLQHSAPQSNALWQGILPPQAHPGWIPLKTLETLLQRPAKLFMDGLGIRLPEEEDPLLHGDLIQPDRLRQWNLRSQLLEHIAQERDLAALRHKLESAGEIPRGMLGEKEWREALQKIPEGIPPVHPSEKLSRTLRVPLAADPSIPRPECTLEGVLRNGWYWKPATRQAIHLSASQADGKRRLLLVLDTLLLAAGLSEAEREGGASVEAHFVHKSYSFPLPPPSVALPTLASLLPLLQLAQRIPLPLWPKATMGLIDKALSLKHPTPAPLSPAQIREALDAAFENWSTTSPGGGPSESESPVGRFAFRGCENPFAWPLPPSLESPLLPDPQSPLAWRLARFLRHWIRQSGIPV